MNNNDVLRRLRYAVNMSDPVMIACFASGKKSLSLAELDAYLLQEEAEGYHECDDSSMRAFLSGFIESRRGKREGPAAPLPKERLSNNEILKAIRVALELRDEDIQAILAEVGVKPSLAEINALFRKSGQKNYKPCGDQFLRNFLQGLTKRRGRA